MNLLGALIQNTTAGDAAGVGIGIVFILAYLALIVLMFAGYWTVFAKLGLPGWMGIVPFVNVYMLFKARGQRDPIVWLILACIPCINIVAMWFIANDTAEMFDKELGWKLFLFFIPGLSHLILGLGSATADPTKIAPGVGLNANTPSY